jgi:hypothetical protein
VAGTTVLTLPAATDTLVGKATTDTLTNKTLTGAVMNGTVGATTPATGAFTTVDASSTVTLSGGTANGVTYLNGSKVVTSGSAFSFDGSSIGMNSPTVYGSRSINSYTGTTASAVGFSQQISGFAETWMGANNSGSSVLGMATGTFGQSTANSIPWTVSAFGSEQMRLTSTGLGVGTTSPLSYSSKFIEVSNATSAGLKLTAGTSGLSLGADFSYIASDKSLRITTYESTGFIRFSTQDTERARITSGGYFKASNAGTYQESTGTYHELRQTTDEQIARFTNTSATLTGTVRGLRVSYTAASPNDTANYLLYCDDSTSLRAGFRSNGGLANFSANNVNLSDQRVKTDIQDAGGYLAKICAIPVRTFKYKDQTDELPNLGVIAQEVEAVAPELVDTTGFGETPQDGIPLKAIYQTDLQYALMKCIQEQQALITSLTARITALETP